LRRKIILILLILTALIWLIFQPKLIPVNEKTKQFLDNTLKNTLISYASVRVINGAVSVIKHSELDVEPAGVGVTVAAGEILDPLDDLTERISALLFSGIISLGVMEILYELSVPVFNLIFPLILLLSALIVYKNNLKEKIMPVLKFLIIIAFLRFVFPVSAFFSYEINSYYENEINKIKSSLEIIQPQKNNFQLPQNSSNLFGFIQNKVKLLDSQINNIKSAYNKISDNLENIINNLLKLGYIYLAMFLVNIIIIPFLLIFGLKKLLEVKI